MISIKSIEEVKKNFERELNKAQSSSDLEKVRIFFLGRKNGLIIKLFSQIPKLTLSQKKEITPILTGLKAQLEEDLKHQEKLLSRNDQNILPKDTKHLTTNDLSIPGKSPDYGHAHPTIEIINEIKEIFHFLGFSWQDGPEVELDLYNFQKLRLHKDHPARDLQQTYYIDDELLLRTQTSTMQIRYMETHKPPIRMLFPGRVYRVEQLDATHLPAFYQVEGLLVDKGIKLTDLLGTLEYFAKRMFGTSSKIRIYGHHFPYTEPSIEVEVLHKSGRWIEIMGAGMVHPQVLKNCNIDPKKYTGFAFGMGPERIAMIKHGIEDIRHFYSNDLRFLKQF
jgi:phenylalanyl-tRNA synthetase alpha chain